MLLWTEHGIALVEQLQVVVVRVFAQDLEGAVAAPRRAVIARRPARNATPATSATPDAMVGLQPQAVRINLIDAADAG